MSIDPYVDFINNLALFKTTFNLNSIDTNDDPGLQFFINLANNLKYTTGPNSNYTQINYATLTELGTPSSLYATYGEVSALMFSASMASYMQANNLTTITSASAVNSAYNNSLNNYTVTYPVNPPIITGPQYIPAVSNPLLETFKEDYYNAIGATSFPGIDLDANFTNVFNKFLSTSPSPISTTNFPSNLAIDKWTNYNNAQYAQAAASALSFTTAWRQFLTTTATLDSTTIDAPSDQVDAILPSFLSYKDVYFGLGPDGATEESFQETLTEFVNNKIQTAGYFLPSQFFVDWLNQIKTANSSLIAPLNANLNAANNYAITGSTLDGNSSEKVLVINRILKLLLKMIQVLQNVGIAQANHLTYTTNFQRAYTALQQQIPVFLKTGNSGIGASTDDAGKARAELNSNFNAVLADNLRALRGLQEDSAKRQQSDINQTNDAVNQQTDMATTFLQQLNTLLSSILR